MKQELPLSRRDFLKGSAAATILTAAGASRLQAQGSNYRFKLGLIGCGGRGSGAVVDCLNVSDDVQVWALGDLFPDRLQGGYNNIKSYIDRRSADNKSFAERLAVTPERMFTGFDNYQKVINSGVDLVILATPPGFRPIHLKAAVEAGKHVFMEKPVATDAPGVRSVFESGDIATARGLSIVAGTQRRHDLAYIETMKRIHDGAMGELVGAQCYWNQGGLWVAKREEGWSDMEWQVRNWLYFTWASGDHICEQHVHNLDVVNWAFNTHPVRCVGMGGRQSRTDPMFGNIYDHFAIEYEYPGGVRTLSMCRQVDNTAGNVSERLVGTLGTSDAGSTIRVGEGWKYEGPRPSPYEQEHTDWLKSIRDGAPLNEARQVGEATLTAIMGRMSAYTGKMVTWEQALESQEDLMPKVWEFGPLPVAAVAVPGQTPLV